ncbi:ATP-binding protein [soil metagenome]
MQEVSTRLAAEVRSARAARRFVERTLVDWHCDTLIELSTLLTSELVTNAILHARSELELTVQLRSRTVRIEVRDEGGGIPTRLEVGLESTSGRGLALVETLARSWGVTPGPVGKSVWFELTT